MGLIAASNWTLTSVPVPAAPSCRRESKKERYIYMNWNDLFIYYFYLQVAAKILTTTETMTMPFARYLHPLRVV